MARGLESIPAHFAQAMVHPAHVFHKQPIQNHQLSRHACLWTVKGGAATTWTMQTTHQPGLLATGVKSSDFSFNLSTIHMQTSEKARK